MVQLDCYAIQKQKSDYIQYIIRMLSTCYHIICKEMSTFNYCFNLTQCFSEWKIANQTYRYVLLLHQYTGWVCPTLYRWRGLGTFLLLDVIGSGHVGARGLSIYMYPLSHFELFQCPPPRPHTHTTFKTVFSSILHLAS